MIENYEDLLEEYNLIKIEMDEYVSKNALLKHKNVILEYDFDKLTQEYNELYEKSEKELCYIKKEIADITNDKDFLHDLYDELGIENDSLNEIINRLKKEYNALKSFVKENDGSVGLMQYRTQLALLRMILGDKKN